MPSEYPLLHWQDASGAHLRSGLRRDCEFLGGASELTREKRGLVCGSGVRM
ncbi:hypothetical protein PLANPX_3562 [Lacipirellula parvula]|uniref:Uncharacterized protein n=1 Tax=Lacipirellula parvula TaxID=2650471 RepID=A0A5K7XB27_9BACT|nr:hypothetical protein PLANPX_3562 [Lacipirellula parvula]